MAALPRPNCFVLRRAGSSALYTVPRDGSGAPAVVAFEGRADIARFLIVVRQLMAPRKTQPAAAPLARKKKAPAATLLPAIQRTPQRMQPTLLPRPQLPIIVESVALAELLALACAMGGMDVCVYPTGGAADAQCPLVYKSRRV